MRNVSDKSCRENQNTHFMFIFFFSKILPVYEMMWRNMVQSDRLQMTIWHMCTVCCTRLKTHSGYNIYFVFPWQQWLHECASMFCSYLHCLAVLMLFIHLWQDLICIGTARFFWRAWPETTTAMCNKFMK